MHKKEVIHLAFYNKFAQLCREKGVTPTQVARDVKIAQPVVSLWKTRGSTPNASTLSTLAEYFGVSIDYLLGREDEGSTLELAESPIAEEFPDRTGQTLTFQPLTPLDKELLKHGFAPFSEFYDLSVEGQRAAAEDIQSFIEFTVEKHKKRERENKERE